MGVHLTCCPKAVQKASPAVANASGLVLLLVLPPHLDLLSSVAELAVPQSDA